MAQQIINNGASPGDPTAESIYSAFGKAISNFGELYTYITTTAPATFLALTGGVLTGVVQFVNGTAAAPSVKVGTDQKGIYHVAADELGIAINGLKVGEFNANGYEGTVNRLVVQDRKSNTTAGGTSSTGLNDRDINTILINNITGASLAANQITLPVGRYYINEISSQATGSASHKLRLYNVTDSSVQTDVNANLIIGINAYSGGADYTTTAFIRGYYFDVLTTPKAFKIQHEFAIGTASIGFGRAASFGYDEIYTSVEIEKVG